MQKKADMITETELKYKTEGENYLKMWRGSSYREKNMDSYREEIKNLKELNSEQSAEKAKSMKNFTERLNREVQETQRISENSNKLKGINHKNEDSIPLGDEFTPVAIDSTSAVAYILNMTLQNQSIGINNVKSHVDNHRSPTSINQKVPIDSK